MNLVMMQAPGLKHIGSMISSMMSWYESENYFGIKLVSGQTLILVIDILEIIGNLMDYHKKLQKRNQFVLDKRS